MSLTSFSKTTRKEPPPMNDTPCLPQTELQVSTNVQSSRDVKIKNDKMFSMSSPSSNTSSFGKRDLVQEHSVDIDHSKGRVTPDFSTGNSLAGEDDVPQPEGDSEATLTRPHVKIVRQFDRQDTLSEDKDRTAPSSPAPTAATPEKSRWRTEEQDGNMVYIDTENDQLWIPARDPTGKLYYYEENSRRSVWNLFDVESQQSAGGVVTGSEGHRTPSPAGVAGKEDSEWSDNTSSDGVDMDSASRQTTTGDSASTLGTVKQVEAKAGRQKPTKGNKEHSKASKPRGGKPAPVLSTYSDVNKGDENREEPKFRITGKDISGPELNKIKNFERREDVKWTQLVKRGKRVDKKWQPARMLLYGQYLLFFRDSKFKEQTPIDQLIGKADLKLNIQDIVIRDADERDTTRENVFKLAIFGRDEEETNIYLVETHAVTNEACRAAFRFAQKVLKDERQLAPSLTLNSRQRMPRSPAKLDNRLVARILEFFQNRPSYTTLQERGILKNEAVFGSTLEQICENENSDVPEFIVRAIRAIESRGLDVRGIYRIGGNAADVQRLRCEIDQYKYYLNSAQLCTETITSAVKLFFRELKEPLFTTKIFPIISDLFSSEEMVTTDVGIKVLHNAIYSMPKAHVHTARLFMHHLLRIAQQADTNQMHAQNLSTVFGPTLLRPENDVSGMHLLTTVQFPFLHFCLNHAEKIFGPIEPPPVVG